MNYPNLKNFMEKYNKAINSGSKEMRITTIEAGLLLQDITELSLSVSNINTANIGLKMSVDMLVEIIKNMANDEDEGF